jgi:hypothetical protein
MYHAELSASANTDVVTYSRHLSCWVFAKSFEHAVVGVVRMVRGRPHQQPAHFDDWLF